MENKDSKKVVNDNGVNTQKTEEGRAGNRSVSRRLHNMLDPFDAYDFSEGLFPALSDWAAHPLAGIKINDIMKTDVKDNGKDYQMDIELPGVDKKNVKVTLEDGYLTVKADATHDEDGSKGRNYVVKERYAGSYQRSWYVGDSVKAADIHAREENGILTVTFPKASTKENEKTADTIAIE